MINFSEGQGSNSWNLWRKRGIGASDISVIMRSNPYQTPLSLWETKCGFRPHEPINHAMQHGINHENIAREWVNSHLDINLKPLCIEDDDFSYFRASLDGWDFNHHILCEIKCPLSEKTLDMAIQSKSIPDYWFDQMQWQIMLSGPKKAYLAMWDYRTNACILIDVFACPPRIKKMREEAEKFWNGVVIGKAPEAEKGDFIEIDDPVLHKLLLEYNDLIADEKILQSHKKELKSLIEDFGDDGNFSCKGFKIQRVTAPPRYDIEAMKESGIEVDNYLKKTESIGWYRISPPKPKGKK